MAHTRRYAVDVEVVGRIVVVVAKGDICMNRDPIVDKSSVVKPAISRTPAVLVVEDETAVRAEIERELHDMGLSVVLAANTSAAMQEMRNAFFDVVITGARTPGADGMTLSRWIKRYHEETEVVVLGESSWIPSSPSNTEASDDRPETQTNETDPSSPQPSTARTGIAVAVRHALEACDVRTRQAACPRSAHLRSECFTAVIDRLPLGVILVDESLMVSHANWIASEILAERDGLKLEPDQRLYAASSVSTAELRELVAGAGSVGRERSGGALPVARPSGRPALSILVTPIGPSTPRERRSPCAVVFVSDPGRRAVTTHDLLHRLYGLTRAEATLACALMQGKSVERACGELDISTNTARTHLKRVFAKTGTCRQGELISLLLSSPAVVNAEPS